jgi:hypothetical protein
MMTRARSFWIQLLAANWWVSLSVLTTDEGAQSFACTLSDCDEAGADVWRRLQEAAEAHYDRSSACAFTTSSATSTPTRPTRRTSTAT